MKEYNGKNITSGKLAPRDAIKVQVGLVNLFGAGLFGALSKKGASKEEIGEHMLGLLAGAADADKVLALVETLLKVARVDGKPASLDSADIFGADPLLVWVTAVEVLQENFADFISGVRSRFAHLAPKGAESNQSN